jgi:MSHA biogenesis protein MshO
MRRPRSDPGFTLVEMVVSIVLIGIVAGMVAVFVRAPVLAYRDAAARADLVDTADNALRRMARDLRLALPNSIRVSADGHTVEFLQTKTGGRYQDEADNLATGTPLDLHSGGLSFTVLGAMPSGKRALAAGDQVVIYNLGSGSTDAWSLGNVAGVAAVASNLVTLSSNPFSGGTPISSPTSRFHVLSGYGANTAAVAFVCDTGSAQSLSRYWGQPLAAAVAGPPANPQSTALLATRVTGCSFNVATLANQRAALVEMVLTLAPSHGDPDVTLTHEVHVDLTP